MERKLAVSMFGQKRLSREGGIEIVAKELCTRMVQNGCTVTCYNRSGHHVSGAEYDNKTEYEDFYVNKLGFSVIRENYRPERNDWKSDLQCGNIELEIFGVSNPPARVSHPEAAKM